MNPTDPDKIAELANKWLEGKATSEEKALLENWYEQEDPRAPVWLKAETEAELEQRMLSSIYKGKTRGNHLKPLVWRAAAVLALATLGLGIYYHQRSSFDSNGEIAFQSDIKPGGNKAILTLSDGRQISLSDAQNGILTRDQNTSIIQSAKGQITYAAKNIPSPKIIYNTISTPKGGRYEVLMSDGTKAILDAGSSLTYPVVFDNKERSVKMTGQVYFTVIHDVKRPFKVITKRQVIEDLGTEFNVKAYQDETIVKTTLVSGLVKVISGASQVLLKPGENSLVADDSEQILVRKSDSNRDIAWKQGHFRFKDQSIEEVMNELERWYDIEVNYVGDKPKDGFNGRISRYKNISQVLKVLQSTNGVKFRIEGRRVTVMK